MLVVEVSDMVVEERWKVIDTIAAWQPHRHPDNHVRGRMIYELYGTAALSELTVPCAVGDFVRAQTPSPLQKITNLKRLRMTSELVAVYIPFLNHT